MPRIWFCGEALIDFVPVRAADGRPAYSPMPGGSPYNAAKAAARAGADVGFLGAISTDLFGDQLIRHLEENGVDCRQAPRSDDPTTLAFVDLTRGEPRYAFFNALSATANLRREALTCIPAADDILSVGSIALIDRPGADSIAGFALEHGRRIMLAVDPNARSGMIRDRPAWERRIHALIGAAAIVRMSMEDLAAVAPGRTPAELAETLLAGEARLVLVGHGEKGAEAFTRAGRCRAPAPQVLVRDSVGAGDTLMGAMLAWIVERRFGVEALGALEGEALEEMLAFAVAAAALNCTMPGCDPPRREAIERQVGRGPLQDTAM